MVKVSPWQCPSSAPVPPQGAWRLWTARHSDSEASSLGAQPLPRMLELAASKAADSTAFDHSGARGQPLRRAHRADHTRGRGRPAGRAHDAARDGQRVRQVGRAAARARAVLRRRRPRRAGRLRSMVKAPPWQGPSSAPAPPQGVPGSSGQLGTSRNRPSHWAPIHCLGCSS